MSLIDRNYEEKRNFIRMTMNASAKLTTNNTEIQVTCIDLSAGGMSIKANQAVSVGQHVHVNIESPNEQFKSMDADGKVVRCESLESGDFDLGIEIESIA
jgi:c-di-GMP-binding flagellar brake protein YcgR